MFSKNNPIIIHTDGGAVNNPGQAGIAAVIKLPNELLWREYCQSIGETTNNIAEYQAVIFALRKVKKLIGNKNCKNAKIKLYSDSQLLINHLNGKYKLKEKSLFPLFVEIWNLKQDFGEVDFSYVPREKNKQADRLVKKAIEKNPRKG